MLEGMVDEMKEVHLARTTPGSSTDKLVLEKMAPGPKTLPADMPAEGCEKNLALTLAFFCRLHFLFGHVFSFGS